MLLTAGPNQSTDISESHPSLLKAEVTDRVAYYEFVISQTKSNEREKKSEFKEQSLMILIFQGFWTIFSRCIHRPSRTREPIRNFEPHPLFNRYAMCPAGHIA